MQRAEDELKFVERYKIRILSFSSPDYPVGIVYTTGEGHNIAIIGVGKLCGDEGTSFESGFHNNGGIGYSSHDAVAFGEVFFIRFGLGGKFCKQTSGADHAFGDGAVLCGIDPVETMPYYSYRRHSGFDTGFMRCDVDAISKSYPERLRNCYDAPALLYYKGNADLNSAKIISIVGTRNATEYGKELTQQLVEGLKAQNVLVVSGLALRH